MKIALFYNEGKLNWADVGTKDDIFVAISYDDYLRLKKMELENTEIEE